jgi:hypothetical protein
MLSLERTALLSTELWARAAVGISRRSAEQSPPSVPRFAFIVFDLNTYRSELSHIDLKPVDAAGEIEGAVEIGRSRRVV